MSFQRIYYFSVLAILCVHGQSFKINKTGCQRTKGCISFPASCSSSENCDYLVTYIPGKETVFFEMSAKNEYIGFGLNEKQAMCSFFKTVSGCRTFGHCDKDKVGTDSIVCSKTAFNNGSVLVGHYILPNDKTPSISKPTPSGLTNMTGVYENGIVKCRYTRTIKASPPMKYDLNHKNYLIYARGKTSDSGGLRYHDWRSYSANRQRITSVGQVKEANQILFAIHAGLMLLAWLGFASIGIFTARYMKMIQAGQLCFGLKVWFQVHRTCMIFTTLLTISGFVVIFIKQGGWSQTAGWHAIIGIIVVSLAIIQPLVAFFRPITQSERRYIFNWIHRCIAVVLFILAMTNCFLGLKHMDLPDISYRRGFFILLGFVVSYMSILLLYELFSVYGKTQEKASGLLAGEVSNETPEKIEDTSDDRDVLHTKGGVSVVPMMTYLVIVLLGVGFCSVFICVLVLAAIQWEST